MNRIAMEKFFQWYIKAVTVWVLIDEVARDVQRFELENRRFVVHYWLVREQLGSGVATHFVRCCLRQLQDGGIVAAEAEVAGLGPDPTAARVIYNRLVAGLALPVQLQELVLDARREFETLCRRGWVEPVRRPQGPTDGE